MSERVLEKIVDGPVPRILEEIVQAMDAPLTEFQEGIVEVIQFFLRERISERILEQIVDAPSDPGCLDRVVSERDELQRLRAQQESGMLKALLRAIMTVFP